MISESGEALKGRRRKPKLRPVEVFPVKGPQGRSALCLRDPGRIAPQTLFLSPGAGVVLSLLDGEHDLGDVQAALMSRFGHLVEMDKIEGLINVLEENLFLDGERFERFWAGLKEEFAAASTRPAVMAGQAYPGEAAALERELAGYYEEPGGPGRPPEEASSAPAPQGLVLT